MTLPIKELRAKAEAATPGEWCTGEGYSLDGCIVHDVSHPNFDGAIVCERAVTEDAAFIAAASPDVVLSLLDECDRLSALHDELLKSRSEGTRLAFEMADAAKSENDRLRALLSNPLIDVALGTLASDVPPYDREPHTAELRAAIRTALETK